jgi:predicted nucleic acid-binding protein
LCEAGGWGGNPLDFWDAGRRKKCRRHIKSLTGENSGVISTQVMQEFYVAATSKLGADPLLIKDILRSLERFETVVVWQAMNFQKQKWLTIYQ